MKSNHKKSIFRLVFSILLFSTASFQFALAGGVTGWGATDGFNTVPVAKGDFVLDFRINATFPGESFLLPTLNVVYGLSDFMEVGVGTGMNVTAPFSDNEASMQTIYPWIRVHVPFKPDSVSKVRFCFMMGTLIPGWRSATPAQPGVSAILDFKLKKGTIGVNGGYSRTIPETVTDEGEAAPHGYNVVSANLNHAMTFEKFSIYEEAFINHFVNGDPNGGFRFSMYFPFLDNKIILDINPAVLWINVGEETDWYFSPNVGASFTF